MLGPPKARPDRKYFPIRHPFEQKEQGGHWFPTQLKITKKTQENTIDGSEMRPSPVYLYVNTSNL